MRPLFRHFWLPVYRLWALRHIRRERICGCAGLRLTVPPGVFHPSVFFSTPIFLSFLQKIDFQGKTTLDVGTGSGLLALFAAQRGAVATALDISPLAVETARRNAEANGLSLSAVESDLFDNLPPQPFDFVLINPPYYPRAPLSAAERAFFAGENFEYFEKLFGQMPAFLHPIRSDDSKSSDRYLVQERSDDFESSDRNDHPETQVWMILSEDCNFEKIEEIAAANGFRLAIVFEKKKWGERFCVIAIAS